MRGRSRLARERPQVAAIFTLRSTAARTRWGSGISARSGCFDRLKDATAPPAVRLVESLALSALPAGPVLKPALPVRAEAPCVNPASARSSVSIGLEDPTTHAPTSPMASKRLQQAGCRSAPSWQLPACLVAGCSSGSTLPSVRRGSLPSPAPIYGLPGACVLEAVRRQSGDTLTRLPTLRETDRSGCPNRQDPPPYLAEMLHPDRAWTTESMRRCHPILAGRTGPDESCINPLVPLSVSVMVPVGLRYSPHPARRRISGKRHPSPRLACALRGPLPPRPPGRLSCVIDTSTNAENGASMYAPGSALSGSPRQFPFGQT